MKEILLTQGKVTLVDDSDYEELSRFKWYYDRGYAGRSTYTNGNQKKILMHRQILNAPLGLEVDHADGNKLNNQRSNIRICTRSQNAMNMPRQANNTSGFKGVHFDKHANKFRAMIRINTKNKHIGHFKNVEDAAIAYNDAAKKYHGEFANSTIFKFKPQRSADNS